MDETARLRNVAVVGPHHAGKTTLVEALLAHCHAIPRRGSVRDGTTTTDHEPEAIDHLQSVCVAFAHLACGEIDVNLIDTPGFVDFQDETRTALLAADAAVVVLDADPAQVARVAPIVDHLEARRIAHLFFINKCDRPGADFEGTLAALRAAFGSHVVAEQHPIGSGEALRGYVDLATRHAYAYDAGEIPVPGDLAAIVTERRTTLLEALADFDDHLMEELLEGVEPPLDEVERDLCAECAHDRVLPVLCGAAIDGRGVAPLVDALARWFPSPAGAPRRDVDGREIAVRADGPVVAQVVKTTISPQAGKLSIVRVFSGTITAATALVDASRGRLAVRCAGIFRLMGKRQDPVTAAGPGAIVALARMDDVATGDTLTAPQVQVLMPTVPLSEPVFAVAIKPREKLDESKLSQTLARIIDEDPSLRVQRADLTGELQLCGCGETHVATACERITRKYKLQLETHAPTVAYRETIRHGTEIHSRYKHQTGGHGQFADVTLRIEPRPRGNGVTFDEKIVGGVVPKQFFPAVEKGVRDALERGPHGYPVTDLHVTLIDGAFHAVDSSEQSFKTAAGMAIRDALPKCGCVVLEPLVRVETTVPSEHLSAAVSQLTAKRGQILGFEGAGRSGCDRISALVPQAELARYCTELRTATQGTGTYTWHHERFEIVPERELTAR